MTLDEVKQRIIEANGPFLYHGTSGSRTASILEHGLDPARTEFSSAAVWVATREIASEYALERAGRQHDGPAVFSVDLSQIPAEQLRADEQIAFDIYGPIAEQQMRADLARFGIDPGELSPDEVEAEIRDHLIDLTWEVIDEHGFDSADPEMVWRSYADTGCLMIEGTVAPGVAALVERKPTHVIRPGMVAAES